ncbi:MAG: SPOR domain-containing protein [Deltaproteobacteria bacterium]|nr:SPOR domain-containing protein [Deltaproteobacteria bacterium]
MRKTQKKLVFELNAKQILLVLTGLFIVGFMVFKIGVVTGSRAARAEMLQARLKEDPRRKITAPSLLKKEKTVHKEKKKLEIEGILLKANEEDKKKEQKKKLPRPEKVKAEEKKRVASSEKKARPGTVKVKPPKVTDKHYFVQVASFPNSADARKRGAELESKGYRVVIVKADIPGKGTYHRVRLGPFGSLAKAKSFALKFEKKEKASTFIPID